MCEVAIIDNGQKSARHQAIVFLVSHISTESLESLNYATLPELFWRLAPNEDGCSIGETSGIDQNEWQTKETNGSVHLRQLSWLGQIRARQSNPRSLPTELLRQLSWLGRTTHIQSKASSCIPHPYVQLLQKRVQNREQPTKTLALADSVTQVE